MALLSSLLVSDGAVILLCCYLSVFINFWLFSIRNGRVGIVNKQNAVKIGQKSVKNRSKSVKIGFS